MRWPRAGLDVMHIGDDPDAVFECCVVDAERCEGCGWGGGRAVPAGICGAGV